MQMLEAELVHNNDLLNRVVREQGLRDDEASKGQNQESSPTQENKPKEASRTQKNKQTGKSLKKYRWAKKHNG